jgi:hypothetical protein
MRFLKIGSVLGALTVLSVVATPAALAAPLNRHHRDGFGAGFRNGFDRGLNGGRRTVVVPVPVPAAPIQAFPLPPAPVQAVPVPVPVPVPALQAALPALQQVFPGAGFGQNPPQFVPLQGNMYAVSSPLLFCGADQAGTCQLMAQQLAQITPGWGTTVTNGPQGYGVYLTFQNS